MRRHRVLVVAVTTIALLAVAPVALGAPPPEVVVDVGGTPPVGVTGPITLSGDGYGPGVAVDEEGTTHVAWLKLRPDGGDEVAYCRVPRPGTGCSGAQTLAPEGFSSNSRGPAGGADREFPRVTVLTPRPDEVVLVTSRFLPLTGPGLAVTDDGRPLLSCAGQPGCQRLYDPVYAYVSTDGGATFVPRVVADGVDAYSATAVTLHPGAADQSDRLALFGYGRLGIAQLDRRSFGVLDFKADPTVGPAGRPSGSYTATGEAVAAAGGDAPIVVQQSSPDGGGDPRTLWLRRFGRSGAGDDELLSAGGYGPPERVGLGSGARLAATGRGTFLLSLGAAAGGRHVWQVRDVSRAGAPGAARPLGDPSKNEPPPGAGDLVDAGGGPLAAAWMQERRASPGRRSGSVLRTASSADGRTFGAPTDLATFPTPAAGTSLEAVTRVRLAEADDGGGAVVLQRQANRTSGRTAISLVIFGTRKLRPFDDVHISGIELTQGVQQELPLVRDRTRPTAALGYIRAAELTHGKPTAVRVYATSRRLLAGPAPQMVLRVLRPGLPAQTLLPTPPTKPLPVGDAFTVDPAVHNSVDQVYTFVVSPIGDGPLDDYTFEAQLNPPGVLPGVAECGSCRGQDNVLRVQRVRFLRTTTVRVIPLELAVGSPPGERPTPAPQLFATANSILPIVLGVPPYRAQFNIAGVALSRDSPEDRQQEALSVVEDWADDNNDLSSFFPIGLYPFDARRFASAVPGRRASDGYWLRGGQTFDGGFLGEADARCFIDDCNKALYGDRQPLAVLGDNPGRDLIETAHEVVHGLGIAHAGTDRACYTEDSQVGEDWPLGADGRANGIGLDMRGAPPFRRVPANVAGAAPTVFDIMSYCFTRGQAWMSLLQWNRVAQFHALSETNGAAFAARQAAAAGGSLRIVASIAPDLASRIIDIAPSRRAPVPAGAPRATNDVVMVARDGGGAELARAAVEITTTGEGGPVLARAVGYVPAATRAIELVRDGAVLAARKASRHAPTVTVLSPRRGSTVGASGSVPIRWTARDADGDPIRTWIDYSADGRTFTTIGYTSTGSSIVLPARLLSASRRARVRLRVTDGFDVGTATVGPFRSLGAAPDIVVRAPRPAFGRADASTQLDATAYDDQGRELRSTALRWKLGPRVVLVRGVGAALLPAGRLRLTVEARDRSGRVARLAVPVRVAGAKPRFSRLTGPKRVRRTARSVALTVATTFPATLQVGGRRYAVGPRRQTISVRLRPGAKPVRVTARLRSGPFTTTALITVVRR